MSNVFVLVTSEQVRGTDFAPILEVRLFDDQNKADATGRRFITRSAKNGVTAWYQTVRRKVEYKQTTEWAFKMWLKKGKRGQREERVYMSRYGKPFRSKEEAMEGWAKTRDVFMACRGVITEFGLVCFMKRPVGEFKEVK